MSPSTSKTDDAHADVAADESAPAAEGRVRVLIVEDDAALRRYLGVILRRAGYEVVEAADGLEGLKLALSTPIAAVVTDAVMPHLGGPELCRMLRARAETAALPIVLLTGLESREQPADADARPDARLTKPVCSSELLDCLARLIGRAN